MFAGNQYDTAVPIYLQIIERIEQKLVTGEWRAGERVPAVRELAAEFGVNPNTMQRALAELERNGLVYSERTAGRFVTPDEQRIRRLRGENRMRSSGIFSDAWRRWAARMRKSAGCWKSTARRRTAESRRIRKGEAYGCIGNNGASEQGL